MNALLKKSSKLDLFNCVNEQAVGCTVNEEETVFLRVVVLILGLLAAGACSSFVEDRDEGFQEAEAQGSEELPRMIAIHASYCSVCTEMKPLLESIVVQCDKKEDSFYKGHCSPPVTAKTMGSPGPQSSKPRLTNGIST